MSQFCRGRVGAHKAGPSAQSAKRSQTHAAASAFIDGGRNGLAVWSKFGSRKKLSQEEVLVSEAGILAIRQCNPCIYQHEIRSRKSHVCRRLSKSERPMICQDGRKVIKGYHTN